MRVAAKGDPGLFRNRLAWDGLERDGLEARLEPPRLDASQPLPSWAGTLEGMLAACSAFSFPETDPDRPPSPGWFIDPEHPQPFEEAYWPFVAHAIRRFEVLAGEDKALLSDEALGQREAQLLWWLATVGARTLYQGFVIRGVRHRRPAAAGPSRRPYLAFVTGLIEGGWESVVLEYPVLGRLLAVAVEQWLAAGLELVAALREDRALIAATFGDGGDPGRVTGLLPDLSDRHRNGRMVLGVRFESGLVLVYKPKDLALEVAFARFLEWAGAFMDGPTPTAARALIREDHGWVEFVEPLPCVDREQARQYFRRAGVLLAVVHLLGGTDCHYENVIARAAWPMLVDLETLLHHRSPAVAEGRDAMMYDSVLNTGFLPQWSLGEDGEVYDDSALGALEGQPAPFSVLGWDAVGTDAMKPRMEAARLGTRHNLPILDGRPVTAGAFVEDLARGFRDAATGLAAALRTPEGRVVTREVFEGLRVRSIQRMTNLYGALTSRALMPAHLRDGAMFSLQFDILARPWLGEPERPLAWSMLEWERRALERMDVPLFQADASGTDLLAEDGAVVVADYFRESSLERLTARLVHHDAAEIAFQETMLRAAFARPRDGKRWGSPRESASTPAGLVAHAGRIARCVAEQAITAPGLGRTWLTLAFQPSQRRHQLSVMGDTLYDGRVGVALFLAAHAAVSGDVRSRELALETARAVSRTVLETGPMALMGLGDGVAGIVHGLEQVGWLLGRDWCLETAALVLDRLPEDAVAGDDRHDLLLGNAGLIVAILGRRDRSARALRLARRAGERLLATGRDGGWPTVNGELRTGFAHGAAGIALALARLFEATSDARFLEAARAAVAFEAGYRHAQGWRTSAEDSSVLCKWCHGAPGVGLSRLGLVGSLDGTASRDIGLALSATRAVGVADVDHLCCGGMGRTELPLAAGLATDDPALVEEARRWAGVVATRRDETGGYRLLSATAAPLDDPGLFRGVSGIGYQMLRLALPERIPSLLRFETGGGHG